MLPGGESKTAFALPGLEVGSIGELAKSVLGSSQHVTVGGEAERRPACP